MGVGVLSGGRLRPAVECFLFGFFADLLPVYSSVNRTAFYRCFVFVWLTLLSNDKQRQKLAGSVFVFVGCLH